MTNEDAVVRLNEELAGTKVLSVYLNAEETDPAERKAWRIRLTGMLKAVEEEQGDSSAERKAIHSAAAHVLEELEQYTGLLPGRGWTGFATPDRLWHASPTPAPMPNLVRWEDGPHLAPYIRAMKQARPVTAVVADRRRARVLGYLHGDLSEGDEIHADAAIPDSASAGSSKRAASHSGMRGEPRGDAAKRAEAVAAERLVRAVVELLSDSADAGHMLAVGGNSEIVKAILRDLPEAARHRAIDLSGVHLDSTPAELKAAIDAAASDLSLRLQRQLVDEVLETTRSAGRACLGAEPTERAIQAGALDTLIISRSFARSRPDVTERLVDQALAQGATVEEIGDAASAELDRAGGIGARLRFLG